MVGLSFLSSSGIGVEPLAYVAMEPLTERGFLNAATYASISKGGVSFMGNTRVHSNAMWSLSLVIALLLAGAVELRAQKQVKVQSLGHGLSSVEVESHRPLAYAARALAIRHDLVITYEDPRWAHPSQIEVVPPRNPEAPGKKHAEGPDDRPLRPRAGKLEFTYRESDLEAGPEGVLNVLERLVEASSQPYEVREEAGAFHLVPISSLDASGEWVSHHSPLDVPVNLPFERRTVMETLEAIVGGVNEVSETRVEFGMVMIRSFRRWTVELGSTGRSARELLVEAMRTDKLTTSWRLFYSPRLGDYSFNVYHMGDLEE